MSTFHARHRMRRGGSSTPPSKSKPMSQETDRKALADKLERHVELHGSDPIVLPKATCEQIVVALREDAGPVAWVPLDLVGDPVLNWTFRKRDWAVDAAVTGGLNGDVIPLYRHPHTEEPETDER